MKKAVLPVCCLCLAIILSGCVSIRGWMRHGQKAGRLAQEKVVPEYSGPKAKIFVADFEAKALKADQGTVAGLRQMLLTALNNSKRFIITENQQLGADLIIAATLTEFEPQASGGRAGIGGGGGASNGVLGSLLGLNLNKAHLALDARIIDSTTSQILTAAHLQGQATNFPEKAKGAAGEVSLEGEFSGYRNTPMETAIENCISEAMQYVLDNIPQSYYKYPKKEN